MPPKKNAPTMQLYRDQVEALYLSGTVSVPRHFPDLGRIWFYPSAIKLDNRGVVPMSVIRVEVKAAPRVTVRRTFRVTDVAAIFIPEDLERVEHGKGELLLGPEIDARWDDLDRTGGDDAVLGIIYVPEQVPALTEVQMGMTAAQSIDYVPHLGRDRSVDHYALQDDDARCPGVDLEKYRASRAASAWFCDP